MKTRYVKNAIIISAILLVVGLIYCKLGNYKIIDLREYVPYISAYTGGIVQEDAEIRIEFMQEIGEEVRTKAEKQKPLRFSPRVKGEIHWENARTLVFTPDSGALRTGKSYRATLALGELLEVPKELREFKFSFYVQERAFDAQVDQIWIMAENPNEVQVSGRITFNGDVEFSQVEKMVSASYLGGSKSVQIDVEGSRSYRFVVPGIEKQAEQNPLVITVNGRPAKIDDEQELKVDIPERGAFRLLSSEMLWQPEEGVQLTFSEPLSEQQALEGLVTLRDEYGAEKECIYQRQDNRLILFFEKGNSKSVTLTVEGLLRSSEGTLVEPVEAQEISLIVEGPKVEILSDGFILPNSDSLLLPFRAKALKAVDVKIIRIYETNILSYLQVSNWDRKDHLNRYGRLVYKRTLLLSPGDVQSWSNYTLDLKKLIKQEPGAIYKVVLSFDRSYAMEPFNGGKKMDAKRAKGMLLTEDGVMSEAEEEQWNFNDGGIGYYSDGVEFDWDLWNWRETDDPMKPSYYMEADNVVATTQVLASNLGMIVKSNDQNEHWIFVTDLLSAQAVKGAQVTLYGSQLQELAKGVTDRDGFVRLKCGVKALFAVAQYKQERSYIKLMDEESNSTSRFDVGGNQLSKGLKGFIYGERGVWRPGDTLFLSFMLQDKGDRIPESHPVVMEVYNPLGQLVFKELSTKSMNGLYTFAVPTDVSARTGSWKAYVKVGSSTFMKSLLVETVKPNRLKVELSLSKGKFLDASQPFDLVLRSQWLTGAIARHLKAKVEVDIESQKTVFKGYENYTFDNPAVGKTQTKVSLFDGNLNDKGEANFSVGNLVGKEVPGRLTATFVSRVFEAGGDASVHSHTTEISPFSCYVGVQMVDAQGQHLNINAGDEHRFSLVTLNSAGKLVESDALEYKIYKTDWSWWWENDYREFSSYINATSAEPVQSGKLRSVNGKATIPFKVTQEDAGTYLLYVVDRNGGHASGGVFTVENGSRIMPSQSGSSSAYKILPFTTDKLEYELGETVTVTLPPVEEGRALVTLENGSEVLLRDWIDVAGNDSYSFEVTEEMLPNVYLHIILLQPHAQTVNDHPIRMYGVKPIIINDKKTLLNPVITVPKTVRPESTFSVKVKEKNGRKMTYTLAVVDEGLLGLTNFQTPDPWNFFNAKEALGIRTWDMFDQVIGAFTGKYGALFSVGGDESLKRSQNGISRFKPVVRFLGPFELKANGENAHKITLPQYIGSVRVMVVALGEENAFGSAEENITVKAPLMLLSTLPRTTSVDEVIELPVNVFAMEEKVKNVTVNVKTGGKLKVSGVSTQRVQFSKPGDKVLFFNLKSSELIGTERIVVTATAEGFKAREEIQIEVRNPNPFYTAQVHKLIPSGESATFSYDLFNGEGERSLSLEVSRLPNLDLTRRIDFLSRYQHSCSEQIASKAVPLLYLADLQEISAEKKQSASQRIEEALKTLYSRQMSNGGFVYWAGDREASPWVSAYIGHFLLAAREKGYAVDGNVLSRWIKYQKGRVRNSADSYDVQAYQLYTLALAQNSDMGAMNRLRETSALSPTAKWCLAGAYAVSGMVSVAQDLAFNQPTQVQEYWGGVTYGSALRDEALILEAMLWMGKKELAFTQAQRISERLVNEEIFNTQSTAMALMALARLSEESSGVMKFSYQHAGDTETLNSAKTVVGKSLKVYENQGDVVVKNQGDGTLYAALVSRAQPLRDQLPAVSNHLKIDVVYTDLNGNEIDVKSLPKSTDFYAYIKVTNSNPAEDFADLALTYIVPSGWEIYNENLFFERGDLENGFDNQDIRDDRVMTYFGLQRGKSKIIKVRLQATYAGEFIQPAIACESMSNPGVHARTRSGRVVVKKNF